MEGCLLACRRTPSAFPQPVLAVILLFPISEKEDQLAKEEDEDEALKANGQVVSPDLYYMQQTVHNACGNIAVLHSLDNNEDVLNVQYGVLRDFLDQTISMSPLERGNALENSEEIKAIHEKIAKDGDLYELDGRRAIAAPINHGPTTPEDFFKAI